MSKIQDMKVADIVKTARVMFMRLSLKTGLAHYAIHTQGFTYEFPVPIKEVPSGEFLRDDKAVFYEKWIVKAIADKKFKRV